MARRFETPRGRSIDALEIFCISTGEPPSKKGDGGGFSISACFVLHHMNPHYSTHSFLLEPQRFQRYEEQDVF